jgi:hypothetical protein
MLLAVLMCISSVPIQSVYATDGANGGGGTDNVAMTSSSEINPHRQRTVVDLQMVAPQIRRGRSGCRTMELCFRHKLLF